MAIVVAALNQDNGHWRDWISQDKERYYAAITWRPTEKITFRANYEDGFEHRTSIQQSPIVDRGLPFLDNLNAIGLDGILDIIGSPYRGNGQGAAINNAKRAVGVGARDGNPRGFTAANGQNRFTFIENDGSFHNLSGSYNTVGYDEERVRHPDGSPGLGDRAHRINDQSILPYHYNPGGPDFHRETDFDMYSAFLDVQITDNWFFNIQFGKQAADIDVPQIQGSRPELRWDPNVVQDVVDPYATPNPYVGRPYFDGDYRRDKNISDYEEIRASTSYNIDTGSNIFGRHRIAVAASEVDENQRRGNTWLALGGNPAGRGNFLDTQGNTYSNSQYLHADNRVTVRNYFD